MTEASAASILAAQTDGSQVAKVHGPDAPGGPPTQNPVYIAGINGGGNVEVVLVDNAGQVRVSQSSAAALQMTEASAAAILAKIIAAPATEAAQTTAAEAREWTRTSVTWTTDDGTAEVDMTLPSGEYQVMAVGHENAQGAGAVSYQIHGSTETGFTPGANRYEFYTSEAAIVLPNGAYEAFLAPVPITVTGDTVYFRIIPDVGGGNTTTGALDIYTRPNQ
jgi:hypothetical protein